MRQIECDSSESRGPQTRPADARCCSRMLTRGIRRLPPNRYRLIIVRPKGTSAKLISLKC